MSCEDCNDTGSYLTTHVRQRPDGTVVHGNPGHPSAGGWALDTHPIRRDCHKCVSVSMLVCPDCSLVMSRPDHVPAPMLRVRFDWKCWDCGHLFGSIYEGGELDLGIIRQEAADGRRNNLDLFHEEWLGVVEPTHYCVKSMADPFCKTCHLDNDGNHRDDPPKGDDDDLASEQ